VELSENVFRMAVEMGCFRMGQWAPQRPMDSEGKTPFAPRMPKSQSVGFDLLRRTEREEGTLAVSDRAVGPGQQRPSPQWGVAGASCNTRSGCDEAHVRSVLGVHISLGRQAAAAWRADSSATGRPPGTNSGIESDTAELERQWKTQRGWNRSGERPSPPWGVLDLSATSSRGEMGAGGTRGCAVPMGWRAPQGGMAPSKWNHDAKMVARATGRLTNWYPQVSEALGEARQENAAMPKKPGTSAWADQSLKKITEQRESEMPEMLVAKQKATLDARDGKAERAAQRKESLQLREAEEVRSVQESLQTLSLDPQWNAKAQAWSADGALLEKISVCANQMVVKFKRDDDQGVVFMIAAALTAGKGLRSAAIRALETKTGPPYALLMEPVTSGEVQPTALSGELAREYPGTTLVPGSSRKMGADGKMPEAPAPRTGRNQVVPFPQVPGRGTYVTRSEGVSQGLLKRRAHGPYPCGSTASGIGV